MNAKFEQFPLFYLPSVCDGRGGLSVPGLVLVGVDPAPCMEAVPALSSFLRGESTEWPGGYSADQWSDCEA